MSFFPEDHPVAELRGRQRLATSKQRKMLESRSDWLQDRIAFRRLQGEEVSWHVDELAAIEQALEMLEQGSQ